MKIVEKFFNKLREAPESKGGALVWAGALLGIVSSAFFEVLKGAGNDACQQQDGAIRFVSYVALFFAIPLVLYGTDSLKRGLHSHCINTRYSLRRLKIGLLWDMKDVIDIETSAHVHFPPSFWGDIVAKEFQKKCLSIDFEFIDINTNLDEYVAIINPYGGVIPEKNVEDNTTCNKIFSYVRDGGLFVNVADVPGYWSYDPLTGRRNPPRKSYDAWYDDYFDGFRNLIGDKLNICFYKVEDERGYKISFQSSEALVSCGINLDLLRLHRVVTIKKSTTPIIRTVFGKYPDVAFSPVFFEKYGEGSFFISLFPLDENNNSWLPSVIFGSISSYCNEKKKFFGRLQNKPCSCLYFVNRHLY